MNDLHNKALLLFRQGRHALAEQSLREALAADPSDAFAHSMLARCLLEQQKYAPALNEAREGIRIAPDDDFGYFVLAEVHHRREEFAEAMTAVERALELAPWDADNWALLAAIHSARGRWADGLDAADKGLALNAEHAICVNYRTMALTRLGRREEARGAIEGALARDPENEVTHCNQGWALLHEGRAEEAADHFREALRLDPNYEWARTGLIEALKARNRTYGVLLRALLWSSRLPPWTTWAFIIGYFAGMRVLRAVAAGSPYATVAVQMLGTAFVLFWIFTVLASPLFTLTLRFGPYGRQVLSRDQRAASNIHAVLILGVVAAFASWRFIGYLPALMTAGVCAYLVPPVTHVYDCPPGEPRRKTALYAVGLALLGLVAVTPLLLIRVAPRAVVNVALFATLKLRLPPMLVLLFPVWGVLLMLIGSYFSAHVARHFTYRHRTREPAE